MALRAKQIMSERISVGPDTTVKEAARKMMAYGQPGLPVVNDNMEVVGVITEYNVLGAIREGMKLNTIPASRIMTTEPTTADIDTSSEDLIQMMLMNNFTFIPIVNKNKYVGMVSRHSIMDACVSPDYNAFSYCEQKDLCTCA
jgi:CBS domain-containing protein